MSFNLNNAKDIHTISNYFSLVSTAKVFLKHGGTMKKQSNLTINTGVNTGMGALADIVTGSYNIIFDFYDASTILLYDSVSSMTIATGRIGTKSMTLKKYIGSFSVTGNLTEQNFDNAIFNAEFKKAVSTVSGTHQNISGKTVSGSFASVYPVTFELYFVIRIQYGNLPFGDQRTPFGPGSGSNRILLGRCFVHDPPYYVFLYRNFRSPSDIYARFVGFCIVLRYAIRSVIMNEYRAWLMDGLGSDISDMNDVRKLWLLIIYEA